MSAGHRHSHDLTESEIDDLLSEALSDPKIKARLAAPFKLNARHDIPLLGSSSIGGGTVYIDRHLRREGFPFAVLLVDGRPLNTKNGLIAHERFEQAAEDVLGWPYKIAHAVATKYEERDYARRGFDPRSVEKVYAPFIRSDESESLKTVPTDLDLRPLADDPKLLARVRAAQDMLKLSHESVQYVDPSRFANRKCQDCVMFVPDKYAGPACTATKSPINPSGFCKLFERGRLDHPTKT
jgi:hypothetical protein